MTRPGLAAALAAFAALASVAPAARAVPPAARIVLTQPVATVPPLPPDLPAPSDSGTSTDSPSPSPSPSHPKPPPSHAKSPSPSRRVRPSAPRAHTLPRTRPRPSATPTASPDADGATSPVQPGAGGPPAFSEGQPSVPVTAPPDAVRSSAAPTGTAPAAPPDTATAEPRPLDTATAEPRPPGTTTAEPTPIPTQAPTARPLAPYQPTVPESLGDPNVRGIIARPIRQLSQFGWLEGTWRAKGTQEVGGVNSALSPTTYVFAKVLGGRWIFGADGAGSGYLYLTYDPFASRWVLMRFERNPSYGIWFSQTGWRGNRIDFTTTYSYANGREYLRRLQLIRKDPRTFGLYEEEQLPDGSFAADDAIEFTRQ